MKLLIAISNTALAVLCLVLALLIVLLISDRSKPGPGKVARTQPHIVPIKHEVA